jgi:opacity protein-like surface antigen
MSNKSRFTQADVTRAVRACLKAGMQVARVEVRIDGSITVYAAGGAAGERNPWDSVLERGAPNPVDRVFQR